MQDLLSSLDINLYSQSFGGDGLSTVLLEVVTPERIVVSREVSMVTLRSGDGELGILPRHMALATTVKPGIIKVKLPEGEDYVYTNGGFLDVLPDKITILADAAEVGGNIDVDRAQRAKERAEARLNKPSADTDAARAELAYQRAMRRLEAVELSSKSGKRLSQDQ